MDRLDGANRYAGRRHFEWPTWLALIGAHALWIACLLMWDSLGLLIVAPAAIATAMHSSLQHEILHGHPTRNAVINEILVSLPVGLFVPFRRFRDLHLKHHHDERLTDPYDDPESFYLLPETWGRFCVIRRSLFVANGTFVGRMLLGPALAMQRFWRTEIALMRNGDRAVQGAWLRHGLGLGAVLLIVLATGIPLWIYILLIAYPGMSLIMVRSFIEHRAADETLHRTAIVEASLFWRLLFLNNNFHSVHHQRPSAPWYRLGQIWRAERDRVLERNGGYVIRGYGEVVRRWGLRRREPLVHPEMHLGRPQDRS